MRILDNKIVFISLCILQLISLYEGRPLSKRTVSEVQLMHGLGEHQQVQERRDWLQTRLRGIHTAAARGGGGGSGGSGEAARARKRLRPAELPDLSDLTPEKIQHVLDLVEKLLKSKLS